MTYNCCICGMKCLQPGTSGKRSDGAISTESQGKIYCFPCYSVADFMNDIEWKTKPKLEPTEPKSKPKSNSVNEIRCPKCNILFDTKKCPTKGCKMFNPLLR